MELTNNIILITGGTSGIGLELGRKFKTLGNKVILLGRNKEKLNMLKTEGFETISCDLSNDVEIENAALNIQNMFPEINVLFNNAGIQFNYFFTENVIPLNKIKKEIDINLTGQIMLTQLLIPLLSNSEKSYIINTTSGLGAFPKDDGLVYSASKAGMRNFTVGLRYLLKDTDIKVIEFIPPVTDTQMTESRNEIKMDAKTLVETIIPQLEKGKKIVTVTKMRVFLWISFLLPKLAYKILSR